MFVVLLCLLAQGLRVPAGFDVTLHAEHTVANDIHCLAIAPDGRIVVSGRGYVRLLSADGKSAVDFVGAPKDGAMGLHFDANDLYVVGDGGLKVYRGADPRQPPEMVFRCKTGGEHTAHAVQRGPDGWLYLMVGDGTGITSADISSDTSPVKEPIGGCVLRFSPDGKRREVFAHGFRNAYGIDFGPDGELYTFDSDNERCVGLPWYEPTRFYRIEAGGHHGWMGPKWAATWRRPPYYFDVVAPRATLGRGSPTGVAVYKHASFPPRYRGGAFACDWTFGIIHFVPLPNGEPEIFLKATGGDGFAPTAIAVHPRTGDLYVSIGGRGTRGGVYRIRHTEGVKNIDLAEVARLRPLPRAERPLDPRRTLRASVEAIDQAIDAKLSPAVRLDAVRRVQLWLGGPPAPWARGSVWEGYSRSGSGLIPRAISEGLRKAFPSGDETLDVELSRTLAMIEDDSPTVSRAVLAKLGAKTSTPDVHYLAVLGRLRGPLEVGPVVSSLLTLQARLAVRPDSNFASRICEIHAALAKRAPTLNDALIADARFGGPEHVIFTRLKGFDRVKAAERFLARAREAGFLWDAELVRLVAELPAERIFPVLRDQWGRAGVDDAILPILAKQARPDDRDKLATGLNSPRLDLVRAALAGLERLPPDRSETLALLRSLRQLPPGRDYDELRSRMTIRVERASDHKEANLDAWFAWARKTYPDRAASLADLDGVDVAAWSRRFEAIDWNKGDAKRGEAVFARAACSACHSGAAALGPDLAGVTKRFSRRDLLTAIVQPSKDVSERYRTTRVTTDKGVVHQGVIVYEAVDGLILQTGPGQTVRVPGTPTKSLSPLSLMPAGLLDRLNDSDIADLLAHLATR